MATPSNHDHDAPSRSSSASLSSPPHTSPEPGSPSAQFATESPHSITVNPIGFDFNPNATGKATATKAAAQPPRERKKPGRKPKIPVTDSATGTDAAAPPKKPRNPKKPKDPNAPPPAPRRRTKVEKQQQAQPLLQPFDASNTATASAPTPGTGIITGQDPVSQAELRRVSGQSKQPKPIEPDYQTLSEKQQRSTPQTSTFGKNDAIHTSSQPPTQRHIQSFFDPPPPPPQPPSHITHNGPQPNGPTPTGPPLDSQPIRTSGQNYDPIRSNLVSAPNYPTSQGSPSQIPPQINRASASPSISSLVDPPNQSLASPSIATQSFFNQQQQYRYNRDDGHNSVPPSPTASRLAPSALVEPSVHSRSNIKPVASGPEESTLKKADGRTSLSGPSKKKLDNGSTATSSAAVSPKPPKSKDAKDIYPTPPPLPGSGLMGPNDGTEFRAPTVVLNIPMAGETNKYVNFTRLAEEQYGWDALHPRLAAQRDRLARVAAAGAALERNGANRESGDEMSVDSEDEGEGDQSNVEMGGMSDGKAGTGTDGGAKKIPRKRKMKEDEYDKDDGFVDDTELLWEEQAAATNDGFFVYSGPLVPEGEKPALDIRADGAPKRARGRGSRGGATRGASRRSAATTAANPVLEAVASGARGGTPLTGPGSRGGSTTRKPRITKADRLRREQEKIEREKMGTLASMPSSYAPGANGPGPNTGIVGPNTGAANLGPMGGMQAGGMQAGMGTMGGMQAGMQQQQLVGGHGGAPLVFQ